MTFLRDLLEERKPIDIEYRCNSPLEDEEDMLFGFAHWDGKELHSSDGDSYYLNDIVVRHERTENLLTVWIEVVWSSQRKGVTND